MKKIKDKEFPLMKKQQESLKNMVYQAILNGIFTDEYKPNQIINEGILHSFPRFGYQVVSVSREEAQNILDFRLVLEGGYLRQSIGHITEENLAELAEIDERCKQSTDSVWDHWEANTAFHLKLISFSGNAYAYQELERTMNVLKRAYAQFYWQTWSNVNPALDIAHHNDIMQSIREKDLEKTQNYLKEDLADFCG